MHDYLTDELLSAYESAARMCAVSNVTLSIGKHVAQLSFAGKELERTLLQSLGGLRIDAKRRVSLLLKYIFGMLVVVLILFLKN